jgi:hypothetical protein
MSTTMEGVRVAQETEVLAKAQRRRFTAAEKLRVLREADRCSLHRTIYYSLGDAFVSEP